MGARASISVRLESVEARRAMTMNKQVNWSWFFDVWQRCLSVAQVAEICGLSVGGARRKACHGRKLGLPFKSMNVTFAECEAVAEREAAFNHSPCSNTSEVPSNVRDDDRDRGPLRPR